MSSILMDRGWRFLLVALMLALPATALMTQHSWAQEEEAEVTEEVAEEAAPSEAVIEEEAPDLGLGYALDNAVLFFCACLVFLMQVGFAMLEAGLINVKNVVNILFKNSMDICIGVLLFFLFGFGIMYPGSYGIDVTEHKFFAFGGMGLSGYEAAPDRTFAPEVDWFYQAMFAGAAATIVSGAIAGRMKVSAYLIYTMVMTGLIYPISGMWKWGGGWLTQFEDGMAFQDFAGSSVVHSVGGFAGLVGAILLGPRAGRFVAGKSVPMPGHSLPLACLGVFILWFGWYGFNPGSQLAFQSTGDIDAVMHVAVTTTLAAGMGGISAALLGWFIFGKPDLSMGLNGILAGLVGITACCDCMSHGMAIVVGAVAAAVMLAATVALDKLQIDDPVGAFPVHGACGVWGSLAIGILPNTHLASGSTNFMIQLTGVITYAAWATVTMFILFSILKAIGVFRVSPEEEAKGLDISEHGMQAYQQM